MEYRQSMKFTILLLMLFSALHVNAQVAMEQISPTYQMKDLQSFGTIDDSQFKLDTQYRILKIPKEENLSAKQRSAFEKLLKSCDDCQEVPQVGGGPITPITPKPITTATDFCEKYPGKFGCQK